MAYSKVNPIFVGLSTRVADCGNCGLMQNCTQRIACATVRVGVKVRVRVRFRVRVAMRVWVRVVRATPKPRGCYQSTGEVRRTA